MSILHYLLPQDLAVPTIHTTTQLYQDAVGRDKTWKFIQNLSRITFYFLTTISGNPTSGERARSLWKNLSNARKGFRLGKSITHADKLQIAINSKNKSQTYKLLVVMRRSCLFFHEIFDNFYWFSKSDLISSKLSNYYKLWSYTLKFWGEFFGMLLNYTEMLRMQQQTIEAGTDAMRSERSKLLRSVVRACCDAGAAFINAKYSQRLVGWSGNDGVLGLLGVVSASTSLLDKWIKIGPQTQSWGVSGRKGKRKTKR